VLCAGSASFDFPDAVGANLEARGTPAQKQAFAAAMETMPASDEAFRAFLDTMISIYFHKTEPAEIARMVAAIRPAHAAFARSMELLSAADYRPRLADITTPTLIVAGATDWLFPVEQAARPLTAIPRSKLVVLPESGHFPFIDEREATLGALRTWLASLG
jgi:pimeloyl-ACP methyl ester carboxylesterase